MKRSRPKQHFRRLKSGKTTLVNKGVKKRIKRKRNYGFLFSKPSKNKDIFLELESPQFKRAVIRKQFEKKPIIKHEKKDVELKLFGEGEVSSISGKKIGGGLIAASVIPVIVPAPLTIPLGATIISKVDKVKLIKTDDQGRKLKIPRIELHYKKGRKLNYGSEANWPPLPKRLVPQNRFAIATNKIKSATHNLQMIAQENKELRDEKESLRDLFIEGANDKTSDKLKKIMSKLDKNRLEARRANEKIIFLNKKFFKDKPRF